MRDFDDEILDLLPEEEIQNEIFNCEEKQVQILSISTELESRQLSLRAYRSVNPEQSVTTSVPSTEIVNLPKLHLASYSGDPKKWHEWWDSFEIIHNNPKLSKVNKFRHLRMLLDGKPQRASFACLIDKFRFYTSVS